MSGAAESGRFLVPPAELLLSIDSMLSVAKLGSNTISNLGGQWPGTAIFATKGAIERVTDPQTGFYGVCACSVAVGLAWFVIMQDRLLAIQALPAKHWIASS